MPFIQVSNLLPDGSITSDPYAGAPCIRLRYTFQQPIQKAEGGLTVGGVRTAWALLDTGADWNLIDETLVPPDALFVEHIVSKGVTGSLRARNYHVTFHIPEADMFHQTGIHTMGAEPGRPFAVILGRKFLQSTRFRYDGHLGIVDLEFFENLNAR